MNEKIEFGIYGKCDIEYSAFERKEWTCYMDEPWRHQAKQNELVTKAQIPLASGPKAGIHGSKVGQWAPGFEGEGIESYCSVSTVSFEEDEKVLEMMVVMVV